MKIHKFEEYLDMLPSFTHNGETLYIEERKYQNNGRPALTVIDAKGEQYCTLTTNVPEAQILDLEGWVGVKAWSENEAVAKSVLVSGLFVDTGIRIPSGHVEVQVWQYHPDGKIKEE